MPGIERPIIRDGYISVPDAPGIGVDLEIEAGPRHALRDEPSFE